MGGEKKFKILTMEKLRLIFILFFSLFSKLRTVSPNCLWIGGMAIIL